MLRPADRRKAVVVLRRIFRVSAWRARRVVDLLRCTCRNRSHRKGVPRLRKRPLELATERKRFRAPRLYMLLRREVFKVNHKRMERRYNEEGLWVKKRIRMRMKGTPRQALQPPVNPNHQWAMHFVSDAFAEGRTIRTLNVVDVFTLGELATEIDFSLPSLRVVQVPEDLMRERGHPEVLVSDNRLRPVWPREVVFDCVGFVDVPDREEVVALAIVGEDALNPNAWPAWWASALWWQATVASFPLLWRPSA